MFLQEQLYTQFEQEVCNKLEIATEHQPVFCSNKNNKARLKRFFKNGISPQEAAKRLEEIDPRYKHYTRDLKYHSVLVNGRLWQMLAKNKTDAIRNAKIDMFNDFRQYKATGLMPNINPAEQVQNSTFKIFK